MSRDKQIEEMANEIMKVVMRNRNMRQVAETLYNAGYRKASDIFEEIESILSSDEIDEGLKYDEYWGASVAISRIDNKLAELKKKYLGEDINAPTKESEGEG